MKTIFFNKDWHHDLNWRITHHYRAGTEVTVEDDVAILAVGSDVAIFADAMFDDQDGDEA